MHYCVSHICPVAHAMMKMATQVHGCIAIMVKLFNYFFQVLIFSQEKINQISAKYNFTIKNHFGKDRLKVLILIAI